MACNAHTVTTSCTHTATSDCSGHATTTSCGGHAATTSCSHTNTTSCTHTGGCDGHSALSSCTGHENSCAAHAGGEPPAGVTNWTDPVLGNTIKIKVEHHNELRTAIDAELIRKGQSWPVDPGNVTTVNKITSSNVRALRNGINAALAWSHPTELDDANTEVGDKVQGVQFQHLRDRVNTMEGTCTCLCNYACTCQCNYACTCNCNYACTCQCNYSCTCQCNYSCTCDCNYACTCDCNYACTCNCDYTCTCNCAYSDEKLKTNVEYM
jgi:hypothetical protein